MEELKNSLDKATSLLILKNSEGGEILLDSLKSDLKGITAKIMREYDKLPHIELLALISQLKAKQELVDKIEYSEKEVEILKEELK
jgi:paraquat-inducible protein B